MQYLSGGFRGYQQQETVMLQPGLSVNNQTVDFATEMNIPLLNDIEWDGIVGLGFRNVEQQRRGTFPIIETIRHQGLLTQRGLRNQFAYYISKRDGGSLTFGGADLTLKKHLNETFNWASVDPSTAYWTVNVKSVIFTYPYDNEAHKTSDRPGIVGRNAEVSVQHDTKAIIDTGTYLIYCPKETFSQYLQKINDMLISMNGPCSYILKSKSQQMFPNIIFKLKSIFFDHHNISFNASKNLFVNNDGLNTTITLILKPENYLVSYGDGCHLGIVEDDADDAISLGGWTLGQIFLQSYYTVFDSDVNAIGFVSPKKNSHK